MRDFSKKYRGVKHFGLCVEEGAAPLGQRDPWMIVTDAVKRTYYEDVRSLELEQALESLKSFATRRASLREFRLALNTQLAPRRYLALRAAANQLGKVLGNIPS